MPPSPFLSIHQYNPASEKTHHRFLRFLSELNGVIARSGLAETEYLVWKVIGEPQGGFGFVCGSLWPDESTYEQVHELDAFRRIVEPCEKSGDELFASRVSFHFELLNPPPAGPPVVRGDLYSRLAMEAVRLESAQQESALLEILGHGTAAIAQAGHPETRLDLWRKRGRGGPFTHLYGNLWSSPKSYEAVHAHPAFQAFLDRHGKELDKLLEKSVGNLYDRLELP